MHRLLIVFVLAAVLLAGCSTPPAPPASPALSTPSAPPTPTYTGPVPDPSSAAYTIAGHTVTLTNGRSEVEAAPGSAQKVVTTLSDKRAVADLNNDGKPDVAVVVIQQGAGTGTFYYLAIFLNDGKSTGSATSIAELLGDRVAINSVAIANGLVTVDYLTHGPGQVLTQPPTLKTTRSFTISDGKLVEKT
jgi:ABC-type glycerol-3-phosphate transport system substrate-binding protein